MEQREDDQEDAEASGEDVLSEVSGDVTECWGENDETLPIMAGPAPPDSQPLFPKPRTPEKVSTLDLIEIEDTPLKVEVPESPKDGKDSCGVKDVGPEKSIGDGMEKTPQDVEDVTPLNEQSLGENSMGSENLEKDKVWREKRMKELKQELDEAKKRMTSLTFARFSHPTVFFYNFFISLCFLFDPYFNQHTISYTNGSSTFIPAQEGKRVTFFQQASYPHRGNPAVCTRPCRDSCASPYG